MYLKRKADAYLNAWKSDPNRSPLIIKGSDSGRISMH